MIIIDATPSPRQVLYESLEDACRLARRLKCLVRLEHNGARYIVGPDTKPADAIHAAMEDQRQRKEHPPNA